MKYIILLMMMLTPSLWAQNVVVHVPGMVCQMCVQGMQKGFKDVVSDPRKDVIVDLEKKTVSLNLKKKISDEMIKERIKDAGYNVKSIVWAKKK